MSIKKKTYQFKSIDKDTFMRVNSNKAKLLMTTNEYIKYLLDKCNE